MNKNIYRDSPLPLYYQLKQIIINMVESRELKENDKLPTENELCKQFSISRTTTRQALKELMNEDYIYVIQGKGTFISPKKFQQDLLKFYSFTDEMKKIGKTPTSSVLEFKIIEANNKIAQILRINQNDKVYEFTRLRLADNEPMILETTYIPYELFPGIAREDLENNPLYSILVGRFHTVFTKAEETFRSTLLNEGEAKKLNYIQGGPAILLERITYDNYNTINRVIEYTKSVTRGDKFKYHVILTK
jgi:GntR family transcriptional regulator